MPTEQSPAIVIKSVDFSESSLILDLYTRNFGKVSGIAKGARRLKNAFESSLDLLAEVNLFFIHKNSDALDILTEAKLVRRFRPGSNFAGFYAGFYLAELLRLMTEEGDADSRLFDLTVQTLRAFESGEHTAEYLHRFEWGLLESSGQQPSTRVCVNCGDDVFLEELQTKSGEERRIGFGFLDGGVICPSCYAKRIFQQSVKADVETVLWMDALSPDIPPAFFTSDSVSLRIQREIQGILSYLFCVLLGRKPRLQDITERLIREEMKRKVQSQTHTL